MNDKIKEILLKQMQMLQEESEKRRNSYKKLASLTNAMARIAEVMNSFRGFNF